MGCRVSLFAGRTAVAVVGMLTSWLTTPPLAYLFGDLFGLGVVGGWIGLSVEIVVGLLLWTWREHFAASHATSLSVAVLGGLRFVQRLCKA